MLNFIKTVASYLLPLSIAITVDTSEVQAGGADSYSYIDQDQVVNIDSPCIDLSDTTITEYLVQSDSQLRMAKYEKKEKIFQPEKYLCKHA
jgi:hypothetical protein